MLVESSIPALTIPVACPVSDFWEGLELRVKQWESKGESLTWEDLPIERSGTAIMILALRQMPYEQYLRTYHWSLVRTATLKRSSGKCCLCGEWAVDAHHMHYRTRGFEGPGDTVALCRGCHKTWHETWEHKSRAALEALK